MATGHHIGWAEPSPSTYLDGQQIDTAATAIALFTDLKSPHTLGHSQGLAELAARAAISRQEKRSVGQVVEARENDCLVLRIIKVHSGPQLLPTRTFTLTSVASGTQLVWRSEMRTGGLMRLLQPLLSSVFRRKKPAYLAALKALLEQGI